MLLLCEAAKLLKERGFKDFHIDIHGHVGEQTEAFQQEFHAAVETVKTHVTWHGRYAPETMPGLMEQADWVVVPSSWWENAPLVIDEAFAHQRPVICADVGGMAEKVSDGTNGLHFQRANTKSLADRLYEAATSPELWQKLVRGIAAPVTRENSAKSHQGLYRSMMES